MDVSRRKFIKISGGALALSTRSAVPYTAKADTPRLRLENAKVTTTACPYCSVGCSTLVYVKDGKVASVIPCCAGLSGVITSGKRRPGERLGGDDQCPMFNHSSMRP